MPEICPEENTKILTNQKNREISDSNSYTNGFKDEPVSKKWWRKIKRIPGLGLVLVILKNLLAITADSIVKKIENIGK